MIDSLDHVLIQRQRWIRRVLSRERVRLVLLMGLHARLGKECMLGELGHEIINGVLMRIVFKGSDKVTQC